MVVRDFSLRAEISIGTPPNRSDDLGLLAQKISDPASDLGGLLSFAIFLMNVGFTEKHPERNCVATGCIHSVAGFRVSFIIDAGEGDVPRRAPRAG